MTEPQTVWQYLAEFNACLQTGFRNRHRIILEVSDHFRQSVFAEVDRGVSRQVAEQRAIAAFGSPQEVARGFQQGPAGAVDRRVGAATRRVRGWTVSHPWRVTALQVALGVLFGACVAVMASLAGAEAEVARRAATSIVVTTLILVGLLSRHAPLLRALRWLTKGWRRKARRAAETDSEDPAHPVDSDVALMIFAMTAWWYVTGGFQVTNGPFVLSLLCWFGANHAAERATRRLADHLARRSPHHDRHPDAWWDEHPYLASVCSVASAPLGVIVMVLVYYPAPLELRAAYAGVTAAATLLLAGGWSLAYGQAYQDDYARYCERRI